MLRTLLDPAFLLLVQGVSEFSKDAKFDELLCYSPKVRVLEVKSK